jgi:hypothetical protein
MRSFLQRASILIGLLAMGSSFFHVHWVDSSMTSVTIRATGVQEEMAECLEAGREAKLRFEMRLCRKRSSWLDACAQERTQHHSVSFDSITESYKVVTDRLGDEADPVAVEIPSQKDAIVATVTAENLPLSFLARDEENILSHDRAYLQARTVFVCKGSVNRTVAHLSQILTFGIVNVVESDSGWMGFSVHPKESGEPRLTEGRQE